MVKTRGAFGALFGMMLAAILGLAGCGEAGGNQNAGATARGSNGEPINIVCTTGMIADIVRNVAGDRAEVRNLIGEGVDPHLYQPTRSDIAALLDADMVFYNGLLLEGKMADALVRTARRGKPVYAVTEQLDEGYLLEPEEFEGNFDPHVWMDPVAWSKAVDVVLEALTDFDGANSEFYAENAEAYRQELAALDEYAREVLSTVPEDRRVLVTAHDAFNYFGERYGYEVVGVQGISTESQAGVRDIRRIVDMMVDREIGAVFIETTIKPDNVRAIVEGAQARGYSVEIGGELFSDAMGPRGTYEGTYIGMIDHNVTTITRALGGEAPERGWKGRLGGE